MKHTTLFLIKTTLTGILVCSLALLALNCIEKPLAPVLAASTVSIGSIPLVDITEYFSEYAQKPASNLVVNGTAGMYDYVNTQSTAKQSITLPTMTATDTGMQVSVGTFSVGSISPVPTSISASSIGLVSGFPVPAVSYAIASQSVGDTSTLRYVQLSDTSSNSLSLTVVNTLPVRIAFIAPILLRNNWQSPLDTSWVANFTIPDTLAIGESKTYTTSIAKKRMWGLLKTDSIKIYTPGSVFTPVSFTSSSGIAISLSSGHLTADSAVAFIPSLTVYNQNNADWVIDDSTILSSAAFDAGAFHLKFTNNLGVNVGVNLTVNELINTSTGQSYSIDTTLQSETTTTLPRIDMSKYYVTGGTAASRTFGTKLTYSGTVKTLAAIDNAKATVRKSDYIITEIVPDAPFVLKSLSGRVRTTNVNIDQRFASNINVNQLQGFSGSIALDSIYLLVSLPLGGNDGCSADYVLTITEKNTKHNTIDTLIISSYNGYKRIVPGVTTQIPVKSVDHPAFFNSLMRFFPDVPDSFYIQGHVVIDPDFVLNPASYSIHDTSGVYPSFNIDLPLRFNIGNAVYAQTMAFDSSQIPTDFTKNIGKGSVVFTVVNNLPLQMSMKTAFLHYNKTTHLSDTLFWLPKRDTISNTVDSMYILAAPVNPQSGWSTGTSKTTSTVSLNSSDMANFNQTDSIYIRLYNLQSTGGQTVRVLGTNYIRIVAVGNITYTIKPN
jgi:hypothetical protein